MPRKHLVYLDGWRGLAILLVLVGHFVPSAPAWLAPTGVELFFVLSGRLMAEMLIIGRHPLPSFFVRRATRLLPALLFYVAAMLIVIAANRHYGGLHHGLLGAAGAIFFFHNYIPAELASPVYEHFWSLAVEEHSYLLLAALSVLSVRDRRVAMTAAITIAFIIMLNGARLSMSGDFANPNYWHTHFRAASILMPFAVYLWASEYFKRPRNGWWSVISPISSVAIHEEAPTAIEPALPIRKPGWAKAHPAPLTGRRRPC